MDAAAGYRPLHHGSEEAELYVRTEAPLHLARDCETVVTPDPS